MSTCYDTFLLNRHEEAEAMADERDEAIDEATKRINAELVAEFRRGFAGENIEMRKAITLSDGRPHRESSLPFPYALLDMLDYTPVMGLLMAATAAPSAEKLEEFMAAAAQRYADDHAADLAEMEIDSRGWA